MLRTLIPSMLFGLLALLALAGAHAASYQLDGAAGVIREADGAHIPDNPLNLDWQAYQAWLTAGNTPDAAAPADPVTQRNALLAAGIAITSTATPALDGTYAVDAGSQAQIAAIVTGINAGKGFPEGAASVAYPDVTGALHSFSATSDFVNFAAALEAYVYQVNLTAAALEAGQPATWPTASATIP